jgi:hypothetical protein
MYRNESLQGAAPMGPAFLVWVYPYSRVRFTTGNTTGTRSFRYFVLLKRTFSYRFSHRLFKKKKTYKKKQHNWPPSEMKKRSFLISHLSRMVAKFT